MNQDSGALKIRGDKGGKDKRSYLPCYFPIAFDNISVIIEWGKQVTQWKVNFYKSESGGSPVYDWYLEQEAKVQARLARIFELLEDHGTSVGFPYVDLISCCTLTMTRLPLASCLPSLCSLNASQLNRHKAF